MKSKNQNQSEKRQSVKKFGESWYEFERPVPREPVNYRNDSDTRDVRPCGDDDWASVEADIREMVNSQIKISDGRISICNPTNRELERLFEYTHGCKAIRERPVPSEEKLVVKLINNSNQGDGDG